MADDPKHQVSPDRQAIYYSGMVCAALGVVLFLSTFVTHLANFGNFDDFDARVRSMGFRAFGGAVLVAIGLGMMAIGHSGLAGSGVVLDPQQARKDLEPWNRAAGGMMNDALDEVGLVRHLREMPDKTGPTSPPPPAPVVKVRCRGCAALNDECAKFCNQCGAAM